MNVEALASFPGHSHVFNVIRRKGGEPGTRWHVSDVLPGTNLEPTLQAKAQQVCKWSGSSEARDKALN